MTVAAQHGRFQRLHFAEGSEERQDRRKKFGLLIGLEQLLFFSAAVAVEMHVMWQPNKIFWERLIESKTYGSMTANGLALFDVVGGLALTIYFAQLVLLPWWLGGF